MYHDLRADSFSLCHIKWVVKLRLLSNESSLGYALMRLCQMVSKATEIRDGCHKAHTYMKEWSSPTYGPTCNTPIHLFN